MAIPLELWERMIEHYKSCPFSLLENEIGNKSLTKENVKQVRHLVTTMKVHEKDLRELRKTIEEKLNEFESK